ncbi:MAG: CHAT domain-containing protein, partial [Planctomycetota bacterium]
IHGWLGDYAKALECLQRALVEAEGLGAKDLIVGDQCLIATTQLARGDAAASAAAARRAATLLGSLATGLAEEQGAQARERFEGIFDVGARAALRLDDPAELVFFLESGRAATLREALGARDALHAATVPEELRAEEAEARTREALAARRHAEALGRGERHSREELDAAQAKAADVVARIQRHAKAGNVVYPEADSLEAMRGRVQEGEALVLYALLSDEAVALVLTRGAERIVRLGKSEAIEAASADLERLGKLVVEPLGLDKETTRVLVSPAGALAYVPFALLLEDREVVYVPSGTTYGVLLDEAAKRGEGVLALGDPDYGRVAATALTVLRGGAGLPPLPGTREEAKTVGDVVLLGADATEAGLLGAVAKRPRWRAVHLACHGLVDPGRPLLSSLALSGGDFLATIEVFRAKVPADLVVLSACETAKGKVYEAEGVVGFVRAFMFAGAPRVLVSLWKVDDEATRALMVKFYELWKGGKACATALREAQRFVAAQKKWKDPKYWAAWQLWGLPD